MLPSKVTLTPQSYHPVWITTVSAPPNCSPQGVNNSYLRWVGHQYLASYIMHYRYIGLHNTGLYLKFSITVPSFYWIFHCCFLTLLQLFPSSNSSQDFCFLSLIITFFSSLLVKSHLFLLTLPSISPNLSVSLQFQRDLSYPLRDG